MTPALAHLVATRRTAADAAFARGAAIWYRQPVDGGYGRSRLVPGVFERYGTIRVAVVLVDASGGEHRVYVSPRNVYARLDADEVRP
jgi:hypothetical protein